MTTESTPWHYCKARNGPKSSLVPAPGIKYVSGKKGLLLLHIVSRSVMRWIWNVSRLRDEMTPTFPVRGQLGS